jgi:hypothetical protein
MNEINEMLFVWRSLYLLPFSSCRNPSIRLDPFSSTSVICITSGSDGAVRTK